MSTRMVFASRYRTHNRCNVRPIGIVAVRGAEICFNAQPALVDGAGPQRHLRLRPPQRDQVGLSVAPVVGSIVRDRVISAGGRWRNWRWKRKKRRRRRKEEEEAGAEVEKKERTRKDGE
ncbi:hypothetical protein ALC56_04571 [Trachymyrmex septentrionalis]|uniref:Uncharacterized protein n=1 Tax=Trachymyrmex septentrionalis TaxID=34720 RepID=A0A195FKN9_9HYME|nr:hypothetical protein ALC56_04571 [Trachymyrmex septentrionalis]